MYRYDYIAVEDWDEVIMPVNHTNWNDMMIYLKNISGIYLNVLENKANFICSDSNVTSWNFKNFYFMDEMLEPFGYEKDIPEYLHMMQHVYR